MINKVILIGNLGADPEIRYTQSGTPVVNFRIATTERWKNQDGQQQEQTEWHNIVVWAGLAEICGKYLSKGKQVYLEGRIQNRSYDDRDGNKRYITEIVANEMQMLGRAGEQNSGGGYPMPQDDDYNQASQEKSPPFNPDDDIPF